MLLPLSPLFGRSGNPVSQKRNNLLRITQLEAMVMWVMSQVDSSIMLPDMGNTGAWLENEINDIEIFRDFTRNSLYIGFNFDNNFVLSSLKNRKIK